LHCLVLVFEQPNQNRRSPRSFAPEHPDSLSRSPADAAAIVVQQLEYSRDRFAGRHPDLAARPDSRFPDAPIFVVEQLLKMRFSLQSRLADSTKRLGDGLANVS
tara:strand:+ start:186 stop:497 length:312 start_codon:yes stop_codon:yes gene_type:complete